MNNLQRTIFLWTMIAAAVAVHFMFISWSEPYGNGYSAPGQVSHSVPLLGDAFYASFVTDNRIVSAVCGFALPVVLVGGGLIVNAGKRTA